MYCLSAMGQQTPLSDIVNITLPKGAEKLTKEKLRATTISDAINSGIDTKKGKGDFYKINSILMQLNGGYVPVKIDYLEQLQGGLEAMYSLRGDLPPDYKSEIKAINNYKVLVVQYDARENFSCYRFSSVSNTLSSGLNGVIEFKTFKKSKETAVLDEMLKSIKFK